MAKEISLNTGAVKLPIKDEFGDIIGEIKFIPTDTDIIKRYGVVEEWFKSVDLNDSATSEDIVKLSDDVKAQFDILLNAPVSKDIFGICSPLTPLANGELYCQAVMEAIKDVIEEEFSTRMKSLQKVEDATKDYK